MLRYRDIPAHTTDILDLTSLTVDEFAALVPPFEEVFLDYMAVWTLQGQRLAVTTLYDLKRTVSCRPGKTACCACWSTSTGCGKTGCALW